MVLDVTEYPADVYYSSQTGERVHAPFPAGVIDDVNYDGSIRAFLFLLNNDCCTSIDKSRQFLSDLTLYNYGTDHQECLAHAKAVKNLVEGEGFPAQIQGEDSGCSSERDSTCL